MGGVKTKKKKLPNGEVDRSSATDRLALDQAVGNARTGLRAGELLLKIYKTEGDRTRIDRQVPLNDAHKRVIAQTEKTWRTSSA